jgi:hypothetical protein
MVDGTRAAPVQGEILGGITPGLSPHGELMWLGGVRSSKPSHSGEGQLVSRGTQSDTGFTMTPCIRVIDRPSVVFATKVQR